jgi:hypothetical protein
MSPDIRPGRMDVIGGYTIDVDVPSPLIPRVYSQRPTSAQSTNCRYRSGRDGERAIPCALKGQ